MTRTTIYCVQAYLREGRNLSRGLLRQFDLEDQAREMGRIVGERSAGAVVFSVEGEPEFDTWDEPRVLVEHGDVPRLEAL